MNDCLEWKHGCLTFHTIGRGFGETVVIQFPDGSVGVIDPFSGRAFNANNNSTEHPIIRFLEDYLQISSIRFVLSTHPHADHCLGTAHFLNHFSSKIEKYYKPVGFDTLETRKYLRVLKDLSVKENTESAAEIPVGSILKEIKSIIEWCESNSTKTDYVKSGMPISLDQNLTMYFLAPIYKDLIELESALNNAFQSANVDDTGSIILDPENFPSNFNWNKISAIVLLQWNSEQYLFCGDAETDTWDEIIQGDYFTQNVLKDNVYWIKIGHHGSQNGYNVQLFTDIVALSSPIGVLTPFNRNAHPLPSQNGCHSYSAHLRQIWTTSANKSISAGEWEFPTDNKDIDAEDLSELSDFFFDPMLKKITATASNEDISDFIKSSVGLTPRLTSEFIFSPKKTAMLHPSLRLDNIEHDFRISHCFKKSQKNPSSFFGSQVGILRMENARTV